MDTSKRLFVAVCANLDFLRISKKIRKIIIKFHQIPCFRPVAKLSPELNPRVFDKWPYRVLFLTRSDELKQHSVGSFGALWTQCKCSTSWTSDFLYLPGPNLDVLKMEKWNFEVISADFRGRAALIIPSKFLKPKQKQKNTVIRKFPFEDRANVPNFHPKIAHLSLPYCLPYHAYQNAKGRVGHRGGGDANFKPWSWSVLRQFCLKETLGFNWKSHVAPPP